jgi:Pentapeptide repeats (8 copies)
MLAEDTFSVGTVLFFALAGILVFALCGFVLPPVLAGRSSKTKEMAQRKLKNDIRGTLLQGVAGVLFLLTAYFSFAQLQQDIDRNTEDVKHNRLELQISADKQLADRFTQAVSQLGTENNLDVRLGGIYALDRIGFNSPQYRGALVEVYTAFVRGHSPWPPRTGDPIGALQDTKATSLELLPLRSRSPDIQTVMRILGRIKDRGGARLDLEGVDLRKADLHRTHLERGLLHKANLSEADLNLAHLEKASLVGATLTKSILTGAYLQGANLSASNLEGANLLGAHFDGETRWKRTRADCNTKWPNDQSKEMAIDAGVLLPARCSRSLVPYRGVTSG